MPPAATELMVELDWLLGLPLESEALLTLWSAIETDLASHSAETPANRTLRAALRQACERQQLLSLRGRCLDGDWLSALPLFLALLGGEGPEPPACPDAAAWGLELLQELHFRLLDPNAPAWELDPDDRGELLWLAHVLLERLEPLLQPTPERLPVLVEQLSRYGAIAWMDRSGPEARERAIRLLLRLAWVNPDAHPWALPFLDQRLRASLEARQAGAPPAAQPVAPGPDQPDAPWLNQAITALVTLNPAIQAWSTAAGLASVENPAEGAG